MTTKILGYISGFDGCGLFRLQMPFKYLNRMPDTMAKISFKYDKSDIEWADIVVVQKQYQDSVVPYVNMAQSMGKPVVMEFDDLMTDIPDWNMASGFYKNKVDKIVNFIQRCNACTVSTDYLRKVNLGINPNIHVLPNSMDMEAFEFFKKVERDRIRKLVHFKNPRQVASRSKNVETLPFDETMRKLEGRTKIVWWGSPTHRQDLNIIDKTLALLAHDNKDVAIVKVGNCTPEFVEYMKPYLDQLYMVEPIAVHNFHMALWHIMNTGPTIALCPIVDLPFNRAKSNLKSIESFAFKAAVVASKVENYAATITDGIDGYLAENTVNSDGIAEDWYAKIQRLLNTPTLIQTLGENGFLTVTNNYNISKNVQLWSDTYRTILGR
jgi:glycosyltransferase involved in cell wall biosynthesis